MFLLIIYIYFFILINFKYLCFNLLYFDSYNLLFFFLIIIIIKIILFINLNFFNIKNLIIFIIFFCFIILFSINLINLFIYYEFILLIIIIIINQDRYYYERYNLIIFLFVFILLFSYISLFLILKNIIWLYFFFLKFILINYFIYFILIIIFLIKISFFFFHYWLLKVHCEVSINVSILLSSIILKLGRFGILRILFYFINLIFKNLIYYLSLLGFFIYLIIIFLFNDLKLIVACSSVIYINLSLLILSIGKLICLKRFLILNFFHRFSSLILFWLIGLFYLFTNSRLLIYNNLLSNRLSYFNLLIFIVFYFSINSPLNIRFLSEIYFFSLIFNLNYLIIFILILRLFIIFFYLIIFYSNCTYGYKIYFYLNNYINLNSYLFLIIYKILFYFIFIKLEFFIY